MGQILVKELILMDSAHPPKVGPQAQLYCSLCVHHSLLLLLLLL